MRAARFAAAAATVRPNSAHVTHRQAKDFLVEFDWEKLQNFEAGFFILTREEITLPLRQPTVDSLACSFHPREDGSTSWTRLYNNY